MDPNFPSTQPFDKRREPKPDGRYVIYYTFPDTPGQALPAQTQETADSGSEESRGAEADV